MFAANCQPDLQWGKLTFDVAMNDSMSMKEAKSDQYFTDDQADVIFSQRLSPRLKVSNKSSI